MKKKIIIHNGNIGIGGQEKMLIQFLNILDPQKYEILLLIEEDKGNENVYLKDIPNWINYNFLTSKTFMEKLEGYRRKKGAFNKLMYSLLLILKKRIALANLKKYLSFSDIIIDYDMGLLRNIHKLDLKKKTLVGWSHAGDGSLPKKKQKRINIERYDYIITINEEMKKGYEKNTKHPTILKIYNFMDLKLIEEKSREKIGENYDSYILNIGSLTENKNQQLLIKAFGNLKKKYNIKEKLLIIGEGKERVKLFNLIKNLNLEGEALLLGTKINPYNYIRNGMLYVICSKQEGMPLTCIEALSLGKMIIGTETNGTREILGDSEYGKLIPNNNVDILENTIYYFLTDENSRKEYEIKALRRANDFNREKIKDLIEEFIDKL